MRFYIKTILLFIICTQSVAGPWFTGPLLAPSGHTIPPHHVNFEMYFNHIQNVGIYNRHWKLVHTDGGDSLQLNPLITIGLLSRFDTQLSIPFSEHRKKELKEQTIGDFSAILGFQALEQKESKWRPDLRITLQEIFPTGSFDNLDPTKLGTDGSGMGSYQTALAFNFQHLSYLGPYYWRKRLSLNFAYPTRTNIRGLSTYGGTPDTRGRINPGSYFSVDLASELSVTQNLVAVMEGLYSYRQATEFQGIRGIDPDGNIARVGHGIVSEFSLAPAVEFNFSEHYGLIAGVWFAVRGKDAPDFITTMIAFNAFW